MLATLVITVEELDIVSNTVIGCVQYQINLVFNLDLCLSTVVGRMLVESIPKC